MCRWEAVDQSGKAGQAIMCMSWSVVLQSDEAGQATTCWGSGAPVRGQSGEAGQATMCWGVACRSGHHVLGEWRAGQARPVRRGRSGHHVLGGEGRCCQAGEASQAVSCMSWGVVRQLGEAGQGIMCWEGGVPGR